MLGPSWQPKLLAIMALISAGIDAARLMMDGDPLTNPNWTVLVSTAASAVALFFVRQNSVPSELAIKPARLAALQGK